jgi:hypothetical protein
MIINKFKLVNNLIFILILDFLLIYLEFRVLIYSTA